MKKLNKVLICSDSHLRGKKLKDISDAWSKTVAWSYKNDVNLIVHCGDFFDHANVYSREWSTGTVYDAFLSPIYEHSQDKPKIPIFGVSGNHDISSAKDKDALSPIDKYEWIKILRKPSISSPIPGVSICAIPWINKSHLIAKLLKSGVKSKEASRRVHDAINSLSKSLKMDVEEERKNGNFILLVGHLEVNGAKREGGTIQSGGSFEFHPEQLKEINADAYVLGHIHVRQHINGLPNQNDGYIGSLCQLSFGEQGQTNGCRLLEIDGNKIVSDRWLDNKSSPKYYTTLDLGAISYRPGIDYVKLRGTVRPDSLPEGVIFEKIPEASKTQTRTEKKLECSSPISDLISEWRDKEKCNVSLEKLTNTYELIRSQCQTQTESIGSLERIKSIRLHNITSHFDTDIETNFDGICAICGQNGSGKSTFIETICLAPFCLTPTKPSVKTLLPSSPETIDAFSELTFISSGKEYRVRREFSRKKKVFGHSVYVYDNQNTPIAGPSIADVFKVCSELIGDPDLVLAGIFSSQGDGGNATSLDPAPRKDLFAKLLGTDRFFAYSDFAKKELNSETNKIFAKVARIESIKVRLMTEMEDIRKLELISEKRKELKETESKLEQEKLKIDDVFNIFKKKRETYATALERKKELENELITIITKGKSLKKQKEDSSDEKLKELEDSLQKEKKKIKKLNEINQKIIKISEENIEIQNKRHLIKDENRNLDELFRKEYDQYLTTKNKEISDARDILIAKITEIEDMINPVEVKWTEITRQIKDSETRSKLMSTSDFPDMKECRTCPLAKDIISIKYGVPALKESLVKIDSSLRIAEERKKQLEKELETKTKQLNDGIVKPNMFESEYKKQIRKNEKKLGELVPIEIPSELSQEKSTLITSELIIINLEKEIETNAEKQKSIIKIDLELDSLRSKAKELNEKVKSFPLPEYPSEKEEEELGNAVFKLSDQLFHLHEEFNRTNIEFGKQSAIIEEIERIKKEKTDLESETREKRERIDVLTALSSAFGRDGIPQLIVDSSIPHLNDIIFELLSECDGKWSMRVSSFKEDTKGKITEKIDILVDDGEMERDISTYSGGEKNLLEYVFRVAFSILQSERSGKGLKVLVLDEPMYFADDSLTEAFMRMLNKLKNKFNQIFIVSHSDEILSSIENKMFFSRGENGKTVVQTDFC